MLAVRPGAEQRVNLVDKDDRGLVHLKLEHDVFFKSASNVLGRPKNASLNISINNELIIELVKGIIHINNE